ncbi:MAG TPA: hypothetical protein VE173_14945, partial [Longimicrobiales bacterium]|nr:hypothetical protein [Longimicrobiales bacterium]
SLAGPVKTPAGLHILQVEERWGQDSARVRHIMLSFQRTDASEMALLTLADSLESLGESHSLEEAASTLGLEVQDGQLTDQFAFIAGAGQVSEGADWAFEEAAPGDVSPVFENSQAFYSLQLVSSTPGGVLPFDAARAEILGILRMQKKLAQAETEAREMVDRIRGGTSLTDAAADADLEVQEAGPFTRNDLVPGLGHHTAAVGAAFGLRPGEVSDPVTAERNVFIIEQTARTPADSTAWEAQKDSQRSQLLAQAEQQRVTQWVEGLREAARIVDRRDQVLQPATEDLPQQRTGLY